MTFNLTRQSLGGTLVLFTLLLGLFWVRHFYAPSVAEAATVNPMPLGELLDMAAHGIEWVHLAVSVVFVYMTAVCLTRMVSRNLLFQVRTFSFLPLLAVAGFGIFIEECNAAAVVAMYLSARGSDYLASSYRRTARPGDLFGGGLMFGLMPLFHASALFLMVLPLLSMPIYKRNFRETALMFTGLLLPAFVWFYVLWATDGVFTWPVMSYVIPALDMMRLVAVGMVAATVLLSLVSFVGDGRMIRTRAYRIHLYLLCFLMLSAAGCRSVGSLPLVAVPLSVVAASWFSRHGGFVPSVVYALTLAVTVFMNLWEIYHNL